MSGTLRASSKKPSVVIFAQILFYLAAVVNLVNGIYSLGNEELVKKTLAITMITFCVAAIWAAARLNTPNPSRRTTAIVLSVILIAQRIIEYTIWHNIGFLLGIILPILVIWRLSKSEAKVWFGLR